MNGDLPKRGVIKGFLFAPSSILDIPRINILLFVLTFCTTYFIVSLSYAVCILTILLAHEMGHFLMCRKHRVEATWPFFLPIPLPPFGTFGAVIKMKGYMPSKQALFDIGAAGPIGGLVFAIPITIIGLCLSEVHPIPEEGSSYLGLGEPILFSFFAKMTIGDVSEGFDIVLNPIAFAGWAGIFVTALNLLPIGQLDGGHIIYALIGKYCNIVYKVGIGIFCLFAIFVYHGWIVFAILLFLFGFRHPAPLDPYTQLDFKRKCIGVILLIVFLLSFTPVPLKL